jgi:uncharacterized protein DUF6090
MLNFLRKLRRNEMKSTRYLKYAFGEIFLVVVGILIALSINTWNEQRKNNSKEKSILEVLKLEFIANRENLAIAINLHKESTESGYEMIAYFNQDISEIPQDKLDLLLLTATETDSFDPRKGQLNSIISSGQINLISNQELTILLSSFEDMINDTKEELEGINHLTEDFIAIGRSYLNWAEINSLRYDAPSNGSFKSNYKKLFKAIEIYNIVGSLNAWREALNNEEDEQLKTIDRILVLIDYELNK